jgi:hypothetical protein
VPDPSDIQRAADGLRKAASNETIWAAWSALAAAAAAVLWRVLRHAGPLLKLARGGGEPVPTPVSETAAGLVQVLSRLADTITQQACSQTALNDHLLQTASLLTQIRDQLVINDKHMTNLAGAIAHVGLVAQEGAAAAAESHRRHADLLSQVVTYVGHVRDRVNKLGPGTQTESD